jgi:hypothetical protein
LGDDDVVRGLPYDWGNSGDLFAFETACGGWLAVNRGGALAGEIYLYDANTGAIGAGLVFDATGTDCRGGPTTISIPRECVTRWEQSEDEANVQCRDAGGAATLVDYCGDGGGPGP